MDNERKARMEAKQKAGMDAPKSDAVDTTENGKEQV
jgi:hypothetical protein